MHLNDAKLPDALVLVIASVGVLLVGWRGHVGAGAYRGRLRDQYRSPRLPVAYRNGSAWLPFFAPVLLCFAVLLGVADPPRILAGVVGLACFVSFQVCLVIAYRVPAPFLPHWLRDEIDRGVLPVARPDRMDWLIFALLFGLITFAEIALLWAMVTS